MTLEEEGGKLHKPREYSNRGAFIRTDMIFNLRLTLGSRREVLKHTLHIYTFLRFPNFAENRKFNYCKYRD